ncbi:MAG TPA: exodeoxyribonuclease VII large subunit, partial [Nitrospirales bacterium]|nr:exodeoxyribonuclease VII large subunit [Nitrospirales bacterium]
RLTNDGWFDLARKRPLPVFPRRVGVVTSPTGAAIRDILTVLKRRCPSLSVRIHPVPVQGDGAAPLIASAIRELGASGGVDVLIVGRGGGSFEDLWPFNEEVVIRAIGTCPVPVVSAVGHETDVTLADLVADYRAPTPSAAAEAVAPVLAELVEGVEALWARQERALRHRVRLIQHELAHHCRALPLLIVHIQRRMQRIDDAMSGVITAMTRLLTAQRHRLGLYAGALNGLSPLHVLARGYAVLQTVPDGRILRRVSDTKPGARLQARLSDGRVTCDVREILPESS